MSSRTAVLRGISWVGLGHVVSQACWFCSLLVLAARIAPQAFGGVAIAMVAVQVAWLLVGSGTRAAVVIAPVLGRRQIGWALAFNLATGAAIALAAAIAPASVLAVVAPGADPAVVRVLGASIVLVAASIVPLALLQRAMRFKPHALAGAAAAAIASAGSVVAVLAGAGVWALVARQIAFQALLALIAWICARHLLPAAGTGSPALTRPANGRSFFLLALVAFAALNADTVVIAHMAGTAQLGLYALAFTLAFAPMTQIAWQIGKVLFPASARSDRASLERRTTQALRVSAFVVLPAIPLGIALAPVLVDALLGARWHGMVLVLQILLVAGAAHALLAILREFLLGGGAVGRCLRIEAVWMAVTAAALVPAVAVGGIAGAALLHVALVVPLGAAYAHWALPLIVTDIRALVGVLRPAGAIAAAETAVIAGTALVARLAGADTTTAWTLAAAAGATATLAMLAAHGPRLRAGRAARQAVRLAGGIS